MVDNDDPADDEENCNDKKPPSTSSSAFPASTGKTTVTNIDAVMDLITSDDEDEYSYSYCEDEEDDDAGNNDMKEDGEDVEEEEEDDNLCSTKRVRDDLSSLTISDRCTAATDHIDATTTTTRISTDYYDGNGGATTNKKRMKSSSTYDKDTIVSSKNDEDICPLCFQSIMIVKHKNKYCTTATTTAPTTPTTTITTKEAIQLVPCNHYVCIQCWKSYLQNISYYDACSGNNRHGPSRSSNARNVTTIVRCPTCECNLDKKHLQQTYMKFHLVTTLFDMIQVPDLNILKVIMSYDNLDSKTVPIIVKLAG